MRPSPVPVSTAADLIDWDVAVRLARAVVPAGPRVPAATRRATVALLRRSIAGALPWAGRIAGLPDAARFASATAEILVVDRAGLITASAVWLRELMDGCAAPDGGLGARTLATAQVGAVLGWLSTRLLGQVLPQLDARAPAGAPFDAAARPGARPAVGGIRPDARAGAFFSRGSRPGARPAVGDSRTGVHAEADSRTGARLLLVAPNVLEIRQRLDLDVLDLPAWVALHEATHLIQLNAAPWLAGHLADQLRVVVGGLVAASRSAAAGGPGPYAGITRAVALARSADASPTEPVELLLNGFLGAPEREHLARLSAILALLEGHAEAVLDAVDPSRMPSVHRLRAVLDRTRRASCGSGPGAGAGPLLNRLIGMETKEAQYADGAAFVRAVVERVGYTGLNTVWGGPANLPLPEEIPRPDRWIERCGL